MAISLPAAGAPMASARPASSESIGRRLTVALCAILLALSLGVAASLVFTRQILGGYEVVARENAHFLALDQTEAVFHRILLALMRVGREPDGPTVADLASLQDQFDTAFARFEKLHPASRDGQALPASGVAALQTLRALRAELGTVMDELAAVGQSLQWKQVDRLNRIAIASHQASAELEAEHRNLIAAHLAAGRRGVGLVTALGLAALLAGAAIIVGASILVRRNVVVPLRRLADTALRLSDGGLDARVPVLSRDEVGQLSHAFNTMADRLQAREHDLRVAHTALEQRVQEAQALHRVGTEVGALADLAPILELVTQKARELLQVDVATLCLRAGCKDEPSVRAFSGPADALRSPRRPAACHVAGPEAAAGDGCGVLQPAYLASHVNVPLRRAGCRVGFLCVGTRSPREFTSAQVDLLGALANLAAIAFEKAALQDEIRGLAAVQERERIGREMHDGLAQTIGLLHLKLQQARLSTSGRGPQQGLGEAIELAEHAYEEIREAIFGLRVKLGDGLIPTLRTYVREFGIQTGITAELTTAHERIELPPLSEVQLLRIAQEALTNVRKHAGARHVALRLTTENGRVGLVIEDDGRGFDLTAVPSDERSHFGLQTMRERAEGLGGRLTVTGVPGRGTRVAAVLPAEV